MGHIVIKPIGDRDEYVYWSTIVEAPLAWGNRQEMLDYLRIEHQRYGGQADDPAVRLDRADRLGSSALDTYFHWDDDELIYEQRGLLPRSRLYEACRLLGQDNEPAVWDLMKPFEDCTEVRRG